MPPRLHNVMIRKDRSVWPGKKTGAESVDLQTRTSATHIELRHSFVVDHGLAVGVYRNLERLPRLSIHKSHHDVQQTNAWSVLLDNDFRDPAFLFQLGEAILRVEKLLLQGISIRAIRGGSFLTEIFGLHPQRIACRGTSRRVCFNRTTRLLCATQQILLRLQATIQTRDFRAQLYSGFPAGMC